VYFYDRKEVVIRTNISVRKVSVSTDAARQLEERKKMERKQTQIAAANSFETYKQEQEKRENEQIQQAIWESLKKNKESNNESSKNNDLPKIKISNDELNNVEGPDGNLAGLFEKEMSGERPGEGNEDLEFVQDEVNSRRMEEEANDQDLADIGVDAENKGDDNGSVSNAADDKAGKNNLSNDSGNNDSGNNNNPSNNPISAEVVVHSSEFSNIDANNNNNNNNGGSASSNSGRQLVLRVKEENLRQSSETLNWPRSGRIKGISKNIDKFSKEFHIENFRITWGTEHPYICRSTYYAWISV
jgi:hypothetical protein